MRRSTVNRMIEALASVVEYGSGQRHDWPAVYREVLTTLELAANETQRRDNVARENWPTGPPPPPPNHDGPVQSEDEARGLFERHRDVMLRIAREAAVELFLDNEGQPITAQDVFAKLRDEELLTPEQLAIDGRWIAAVFKYSGSNCRNVGQVRVEDPARNCHGALRAAWALEHLDDGTHDAAEG